MKKFICVLLSIILLGLLPACQKKFEKRGEASSIVSSQISSEDWSDEWSDERSEEWAATSSGSNNPPQPSIAPREPLPDPSVITAIDGNPISEINAEWAREVSGGFVEEYKNGDFVVVEGTDIGPLFSWMDDVLLEHPGEAPTEGILKTDYEPLRIYRYNAEGKLLWKKTYGKLTNAIHKTFALSDNSLLVVTYRDFRAINIISAEFGGDMTKFSPDGEILWSRKLTENHSYMDEFFEGKNGEFYAFGEYRCNSGNIKEVGSAKMLWSWCEQETSARPTITRYDSEGNVLATCLPDILFSHLSDGRIESYSNAAYQRDVGLLCDLGTKLVCYDENLKVNWSEDYPDTDIRDRDIYPDNSYQTDAEMTVQNDGITITAQNHNYTKLRDLRFSFEGKKLGEEILDLNKKPVSDWNLREIYSLPDERKVFMELPENGKNRMVLYFEEKGKLTEFDSFEAPLSPNYDSPVTPTADGGFFIRYMGHLYDDNDIETSYYVLTKYNAQGRTEIQCVYQEWQRPVPSKSGWISLLRE